VPVWQFLRAGSWAVVGGDKDGTVTGLARYKPVDLGLLPATTRPSMSTTWCDD